MNKPRRSCSVIIKSNFDEEGEYFTVSLREGNSNINSNAVWVRTYAQAIKFGGKFLTEASRWMSNRKHEPKIKCPEIVNLLSRGIKPSDSEQCSGCQNAECCYKELIRVRRG